MNWLKKWISDSIYCAMEDRKRNIKALRAPNEMDDFFRGSIWQDDITQKKYIAISRKTEWVEEKGNE